MSDIPKFINTQSATVKDHRSLGGEVIILPLKQNVEVESALLSVVSDLMKFLSQSTGKMYSKNKEGFGSGYRITEPGHIGYGLKVFPLTSRIIIQPIAILEDRDILRRYVQRIKKLSKTTPAE